MQQCQNHGLSKEASDTLYKQAKWGGAARIFSALLPGKRVMRRFGRFTRRHPYLGALAVAAPTAAATTGLNSLAYQEEQDFLNAPTLTPTERMLKERLSSGLHYSGLGLSGEDLSGFGFV